MIKSQNLLCKMEYPRRQRVKDQEQRQQKLESLESAQLVIKDPRFRNAQKYWDEMHFPENVPCRDNEKQQIYKFIVEGLNQRGSKQSLYISGVPGIGKTVCVQEVIKNIQLQYGSKKFKYVYLNAMKLSKQIDIFKSLYKGLIEQKDEKDERKQKNEKKKRVIDAKSAMFILNDLFRKGIAQSSQQKLSQITKLVVIDEIDYLNTKDNDVLYNIFDWTQNTAKGKLIIVAISNTISFPQQLSQKILSRIGERRLIFKQYTCENMQTIIEGRIKQIKQPIVEQKGLIYISKKITKSSSDVRKILGVLRQAVYLHMKLFQYKTRAQLADSLISYETLNNAYDVVLGDPLHQQFRSMPQCYKKLLGILGRHYSRQYNSITMTKLYDLSKQLNMQKGDVRQILIALKQMGIVSIRAKKMTIQQKNKTFFLIHMDQDLIELKFESDHLLSSIPEYINI